MATIIASMFMALDGVVDPMVGNWHFPYFNDEMGEAVTGTHEADVMLFGRVTYDSFAGAWPERERPAGTTPRWRRTWVTCGRSSRHGVPCRSSGATRSSCKVISSTP